MGKMFDRVFGRTPMHEEMESELLLTPEMEAPPSPQQRPLAEVMSEAAEVFRPMGDGMVRQPDRATSIAAAIVAKRSQEPLRAQVLRFAKDAGPGGFIDDDLREIDSSRPESSLRKRRTELAEKNWILPHPLGFTRINNNDQEATVWLHRDFVDGAPPLVSAPKKRKLSAERTAAERERAKIVVWLKRFGDSDYYRVAERIRLGEHL